VWGESGGGWKGGGLAGVGGRVLVGMVDGGCCGGVGVGARVGGGVLGTSIQLLRARGGVGCGVLGRGLGVGGG